MQPFVTKPIHDHVRILCAEEADLEALEWEGEYSHFRRLFADTFQLALHGQAKIWIAKTIDGNLIGQLIVSLNGGRIELADGKTRAYIFGFRIRPAYRNQGIGAEMMFMVEKDLRKNGFRKIALNVAQTNHAARRFYERLGYQVVGDDPGRWSYLDQFGERRDVHEPAWRMEKDLY
jgi:ribosomal protein S18 acetylase RimI-like enzyme